MLKYPLTQGQVGGNSLETQTSRADLLEEAKRIVKAAEDKQATLRLIGGLGIRFHCHGEHSAHLREYHDIDLFGLEKESKVIFSVFEELGYSPNTKYNILYGESRL